MPAEVCVFRDPDELGEALADEILAAYGRAGGRFLLGCPGGRSLRSTYRALARRRPDVSRLVARRERRTGTSPSSRRARRAADAPP
jgi:glucosamine-6-phosphate deaminase